MTQHLDIFSLTAAERILLAEELWDTLAYRPELAPIPPEHLVELNRRMVDEEAGETTSLSWEEVKLQLFPGG